MVAIGSKVYSRGNVRKANGMKGRVRVRGNVRSLSRVASRRSGEYRGVQGSTGEYMGQGCLKALWRPVCTGCAVRISSGQQGGASCRARVCVKAACGNRTTTIG